MDMCRGRSARAGSRWIHGLSPSRSNVIITAQRAPSGQSTTGGVMAQEDRPRERHAQWSRIGTMNIFKTLAVKDLEAATRAIPVIDFAPAFRGEPGGLEAVASQVQRASEEVG